MFKIILHKTVKTKMRGKTYTYFKDLGYNIKFNDELDFKWEDLPDFCVSIEERLCDCCKKPFKRPHRDMIKFYNSYNKDVCQKCIAKEKMDKVKQTNLERYGVDNPLKNEGIRQKMSNTILERYGTDNIMKLEETKLKAQKTCEEHFGCSYPMQSDEVKEKSVETLIKNYGVDNPTKSKEIQEKTKLTCLEKYGVDNPFKSEEIKDKIKASNLEKYGVENPMQYFEIKQKAINTLSNNGTFPTSSQQISVFEMCKELYPNCEINLNVPVLYKYILDIVLKIEDEKINIEYDGCYWHQDIEKDKVRYETLINNGYKVLRIRSGNLLPTKEELKNGIESLLKNENETHSEIKLSDWKLK